MPKRNVPQWIVSVIRMAASARFALALVSTARAATFHVDRTDDVASASECRDDVANDCSLRGAISAANNSPGANAIVVPAGSYTLTIPATAFEDGNANGDLDINSNLDLRGAGAAATIVQACAIPQSQTTCKGIDRVFDIDPSRKGVHVSLSGITIRNGFKSAYADYVGGAIRNRGVLAIQNSVITGNRASNSSGYSYGGAIANDGGTLTIANSTISDSAAYLGGGIYNTGLLTMSGTVVAGNISGYHGGGIATGTGFSGDISRVILVDSTISGNTSSSGGGGGIAKLTGALVMRGCTVSGNIAVVSPSGGLGGGIENGVAQASGGNTTLRNCTITDNRGISGGGIYSGPGQFTLNNCTIARNSVSQIPGCCGGSGGGVAAGSVLAQNTIIADNHASASPDCSAALQSGGYNLIQDASGCVITGDLTGNITGRSADLTPLGDNGGLTLTSALLPASPAIDGGNPAAPDSGSSACEATDQRGVVRSSGSRCDIGAVEFQGGFRVSGVSPGSGTNKGRAVVMVFGSDFAKSAAVKLRRAGESDIPGVPANSGESGQEIAATFDLDGRSAGSWDVVVTNPDGASAEMKDGFSIQEDLTTTHLWMDVIGRSNMRVGVPSTLTILFGNAGPVDLLAVPMFLGVPKSLISDLRFQVLPPPAQTGQIPTDWSQVPIDLALDGLQDSTTPLIVPVIPAGFSGVLQLTVLAPPETHGQTLLGTDGLDVPYFEPTLLNAGAVGKLVQQARAYAERVFGRPLPPDLNVDLSRYISNELQNMVQLGRNALVESLGKEFQVYSLPQLLADAAQYGASLTGNAAKPTAVVTKNAPSTCVICSRFECDEMGWVVKGNNCVPPPCVNNATAGGPGPLSGLIDFALNFVPSEKGTVDIGPNALPGAHCNGFPIGPGGAIDPNDKVGSLGAGAPRFLTANAPLRYSVLFENLAQATLPAQEVLITDRLDAAKFDLSTFALGPIYFGRNTVVTPSPGLSQFSQDVDLRPAQNLLVRIVAGLDTNTGIAAWRFTTLSPSTLERTSDTNAGFLPPDVNPPEGEGGVLFTIRAKANLPTGTRLTNQASVVFDVNSPIRTPAWLNTIDTTKPSSQVSRLASTQASSAFPIEWSGTDQGSGIRAFTVFASDNGGTFMPVVSDTANRSLVFSGQAGHKYSFVSMAADQAGNVEDLHAAPDATTTVQLETGPVDVTVSTTVRSTGLLFSRVTRSFTSTVTITNIAAAAIAGPIQLVLEGLPDGVTLLNASGHTKAGAPYVTVTPGKIEAGASSSIAVSFSDTSNAAIGYQAHVFSGHF